MVHNHRFTAVLMDLTSPEGEGGNKTIPEMLAYQPESRTIISNGSPNDPIMAEVRKRGI